MFKTSTGQILNPQLQKAQVAKAILQQQQQQQQQQMKANELQLLQRLRNKAQPTNGRLS